ncbi:MAG: hypothetical protein ABIT47_01865 [Candidatus Paceibacterota bacterium]
MSFIYHAVPRNMTGTVLYPLNELRTVSETAHATHASKYEGREHLTEVRIPTLGNCLWNDVLFFIATPPSVFWHAYESAGFDKLRLQRHFQFDVTTLDQSKLAVLTKMEMNRPDVYEPFDPSRMDEYATIPQETYDYWAEELASGNTRPMLYMHIPHILYRGSLDTSGVPVVEA